MGSGISFFRSQGHLQRGCSWGGGKAASPTLPQVTCREAPGMTTGVGGGRERSWLGQEVKTPSTHLSPPFQATTQTATLPDGQTDRARPWSPPAPGESRDRARGAGQPGPGSGSGAQRAGPERRARDTQTRTRRDKLTDSARGGRARLTAGRRVRRESGRRRAGATSQGAIRRAASRARRGESRRPLPANSAGRPALPSPAAARSARGSWGLRASRPSRAAPRGPPNFQRCPAPRPRRRLGVSIVGPGRAHSAGVRGPGAPRRPRPPPPLQAPSPPPSPAAPGSLAVTRSCSRALPPALRSAPGPAALGPGPATPRPPGLGSPSPPPPAGLCRHLPNRSRVSLLPPGSPPRSRPGPSPGLPASCGPARPLPAGSPSPSRSPAGLPPPASPRLPLPALPLSPARLCPSPSRPLSFSVSPPPTLRAAPSVSDPGPRLGRVPGSPGSPSSRRPRRAENSQLAARRPALRDFRPSSHVTRAPLRRPRAPQPGNPGCPRDPALPAPRPNPASSPLPRGPRRGAGAGAGGCWPRSCPGSCPGFPPRPRSAPPRTRSWIRSRVLCPPPQGAGGEGSFEPGRGWVGAGPSGVPRSPAPLLSGPRTLPKYRRSRTRSTSLWESEGALLEGPSRSVSHHCPILQMARLGTREGQKLGQGHPEMTKPGQTLVSCSLSFSITPSCQAWAPHSGVSGNPQHPQHLSSQLLPDILPRHSSPPRRQEGKCSSFQGGRTREHLQLDSQQNFPGSLAITD